MKTDTSTMGACKGLSKQLPNQSAITGATPPRSKKPGALPAGVAMHMAPVGEGTNQHQQSKQVHTLWPDNVPYIP